MKVSLKRSDVVIIGGGIVGICSAYYLKKMGFTVTVCEKGVVAGEQSSQNWGFVRQQGRDPAEIPAIIESLRIWRGLSDEIGEDVGFKQAGILYLANSEQQVAGYENWLRYAKQFQIDSKLISPREINERLPHSKGDWIAALYTPSDGRAEPSIATQTIARAARNIGVDIKIYCAVRGLELSAGRVSSVITEAGEIRTESVICAGGVWSSLFCARHGIVLPQVKVRSSVFRTKTAPLLSEHSIWSKDVALRRRQDGGYSIAHGSATEVPIVPDILRWFNKFIPAYKIEKRRLKLRLDTSFYKELMTQRRWNFDGPTPFENNRVYQVAPNQKILTQAFNNLRRLFPVLKDVEIEESWAGLIDVTPDAVPVITPVKQIPGFFLATGFSGHGFGMGPIAGKLAAEMVTNSPATVDMRPFRLDRFFDD